MMYLGLAPGRDKVGFAFVDEEGKLIYSGILPASDLDLFLSILMKDDWERLKPYGREGEVSLLYDERLKGILLGGGTTSEKVELALKRLGLNYEVVDESFSTERARGLYFQIHPPRGLRKYLPRSLLVPNRDVDDLAAWELVKMWLQR